MEKQTVIKLICGLVLLLVIAEAVVYPQQQNSLSDLTTGDYMKPIYELGLGLQLGMISFTYVCILTRKGNLLAGFRQWVENKYLLFHVKTYGNDTPEKLAVFNDKLAAHRWYLKPILTCAWCVGGQIALWVFPLITRLGYTFNGHLSAICVSILISGIAEELYTRWKPETNKA